MRARTTQSDSRTPKCGTSRDERLGGIDGRVLIAVVVSLAAHALLLLIPLGEAHQEEERRRVRISSLDSHVPRPIEEVSPKEDADGPEEDAPARTGVPPEPEVASKEEPGEPAAPREIARSDSKPAPDPVPPPMPVDEPPSLEPEVPARDEPRDRKRAPVASEEWSDVAPEDVDLLPADVLSELGRPQSSPPPAEDPGETLHEPPGLSTEERKEMAEERLTAYVRHEKARHRVEAGLIDPYFVRLRETFDDVFEPAWAHFDADDGDGLIDSLGAWLRDYRGSMERYAETGSPYHQGESSSVGPYDPLAHPSGPAGTLAPNDSREDLRREMLKQTLFLDIARGLAGGAEVVAVLRVTQSQSGTLLRVSIERSSGRPAYDELARDAVRSALSDKAVPTRAGEGLGLTGERIETLWAFRTKFVVVPLMPVTACEFSSDGGVEECLRPLQRRALPRIELEAVY